MVRVDGGDPGLLRYFGLRVSKLLSFTQGLGNMLCKLIHLGATSRVSFLFRIGVWGGALPSRRVSSAHLSKSVVPIIAWCSGV